MSHQKNAMRDRNETTTTVSTLAPVHLVEGRPMRVAEFDLAAGCAGEWHYHHWIEEHCYALDHELHVDIVGQATQVLRGGQRCAIAAEKVHRVRNPGAKTLRYLVIQGPGLFDYQQVASTEV